MGNCLGHLPHPVFNWFGETQVTSKCRRCSRKAGGGDSWHPLLRTDSQELFTTVKWTKGQKQDTQKGDDHRHRHRRRQRGSFTRCHSDPESWGCETKGNPVQGESSGEESEPGLKMCSSTRICTTNRAESNDLDLCTCNEDESSEPESEQNMLQRLSTLTQIQTHDYKCCFTPEDSDYFWDAETSGGEKENDQDSTKNSDRGTKSFEVWQKMSSRSKSSNSTTLDEVWAGGDNGTTVSATATKTGSDAAILPLDSTESKKHYFAEESDHLFPGSF